MAKGKVSEKRKTGFPSDSLNRPLRRVALEHPLLANLMKVGHSSSLKSVAKGCGPVYLGMQMRGGLVDTTYDRGRLKCTLRLIRGEEIDSSPDKKFPAEEKQFYRPHRYTNAVDRR